MDADFLFSEAGIDLQTAYGDEGIFVYLGLHSLMWKAEDSRLSIEKIPTHAKRIFRDSAIVKEITDFLISIGVFTLEDGFFFSPSLKADKDKMQAKQEIYRRNAKCKTTTPSPTDTIPEQWHQQLESNSSAIAPTIAKPLQSKSKEQELEPEKEQELEDLKKNSLEFDTLKIKLRSAGISFEGCAERAYELAQGQYKTKKPDVFQLTKGWVYQELLKEQKARIDLEKAEIQLSNAKNGYKPPPETPEQKAERRKRFLEMNK